MDGMHLSRHAGVGSIEVDLASSDDSSLLISADTVAGSKSVSDGTSLGMMTGMAAELQLTHCWMLATLLTKDLAKSSALSLAWCC